MTIENQSKLAIIIVGWRNRRSVAVLFLHLLLKQIEQQQSSDAAFTAATVSTRSQNVRRNTDAFFADYLQSLDNSDVVSATFVGRSQKWLSSNCARSSAVKSAIFPARQASKTFSETSI